MDEHLGQVGAVRLVLRLGEHELDGADDACVVLGDQQRPPPRRNVVGDAAPELLRPGGLEGMEEADARVAVDRVDEDARERLDLRVVDRVEPPDRRPAAVLTSARPSLRRMIVTASSRSHTLPVVLLDIFLYRHIMDRMARAATTTDAFNAVAEPRRRQILDLLAGGERPVNDLVRLLGLAQPQVSKHLRVLREVGAVDVREEGRQRLYSLNGQALKPIHDWVKGYERIWTERFDALDLVLDELERKEDDDDDHE